METDVSDVGVGAVLSQDHFPVANLKWRKQRQKDNFCKYDKLKLIDGKVYWRTNEEYDREKLLHLVPRESRENVMEEILSSAFSGYLGIRKTLDKIRARFYWPYLWTDVKSKFWNATTARK